MSAWKKLLAAPAGGAGLDVDEVFSTYLYTGTGNDVAKVNGIDLAGEGGMVWTKGRSFGSASHALYDTERGLNFASGTKAGKLNSSLDTDERQGVLSAFNSNGFTENAGLNQDIVSWTWRKAPKFFDIVTYTGNGSSITINHNLESTVGSIWIKCRSDSKQWSVYHRSSDYASNGLLFLNSVSASPGYASSTAYQGKLSSINSSSFVVTKGAEADNVNTNGETYVAYIFAHNDGDGEFGPDSDQDIIKCGDYTGNGSTTGPVINLGFEPQWLLIKNSSADANWELVDNMRDFRSPKINVGLFALNPNLSDAEAEGRAYGATSTGFSIVDDHADVNASNNKYIYMAIRRGPLFPPEAGTEVFGIKDRYSEGSLPTWQPGFVTDMAMRKRTSGSDSYIYDRLRQGKELAANATSTEATSSNTNFDYMTGWGDVTSASSGDLGWNWKRAPSYFDVVAYNGDATSSPNSRNINHNLGVAPEMMWIKCRTAAENWAVYHSGTGATKYLNLNNTAAAATSANWWRNTAPTDTVFTIGHQDDVNLNGGTHIAYLFATLAGVSKVGSYTGNGSSQTIDCGFSSGARFVYVKRTDSSGDWYIWDTTRGIIAGNDPHLSLNTTAAQVTSDDSIDPASSGFAVNQVSATNINVSSATYLFYAIA